VVPRFLCGRPNRGPLVAVNSSGGKDSQKHNEHNDPARPGRPRDQLVAVHAPLGEVEWPGTIAHIENTMPAGVPLILARVASGKSLLERVEERPKFPSMRNRSCTSNLYGELPIEIAMVTKSLWKVRALKP